MISRTKTYNYLGLILDEKFSWADHINEVCWKLSQAAGVIFKVRHLLSKDALILIYHALVGQKLRYGLICWATASKFLLSKVNVIHNKVVRYLTFSKTCSAAGPLYRKLDLLPLDLLIEIEWGKFMYKFENGLLPGAFNNYFSKPQHHHNTRYSTRKNFQQTQVTNARDKTSIKCIGPKKWSALPLSIKDSPSLKIFKQSLRAHLIDTND